MTLDVTVNYHPEFHHFSKGEVGHHPPMTTK